MSKYQRLRVLAAEPNWLENRLSLANATKPDNVARKQWLRRSVPLYSSNRRVLSELKGVACGSFRVEIVGSESPLDFEQIDYPNIPKRRRAAFRRKVKVRYASLLRAIP